MDGRRVLKREPDSEACPLVNGQMGNVFLLKQDPPIGYAVAWESHNGEHKRGFP